MLTVYLPFVSPKLSQTSFWANGDNFLADLVHPTTLKEKKVRQFILRLLLWGSLGFAGHAVDSLSGF